MTKLQFLLSLHEKLSALPENEAEEHLRFYTEMIEDRMEEGLSEEEAVAAVGDADEIAAQILKEFPTPKPAPEYTPPEKPAPKRRRGTWEILLLILGAPLWLPLLIAALAVVLSLYVSIWSVILSLWTVFVSTAVCVAGGMAAGVGSILTGHAVIGTAMLAVSAVCAGVSILLFFLCKWISIGMARLTTTVLWGKKRRKAKEVRA